MSRARRRVVVTGAGAVTPLGADVASTWAGAVAGRSAVRPIQRFDPTGLPVTFAAEAPDPGLRRAREVLSSRGGSPLGGADRLASLVELLDDLKGRLAAVACDEALGAPGLGGGPRVGVCMGSEAARPPQARQAHGSPGPSGAGRCRSGGGRLAR